jgi:hydrophobe/amphiphile efflux-1 (HAE1) family protein
MAQKISQVPGVGQVTVGGGQQPAVRVQADPFLLAARGLTLGDVRDALGNATANQPKGSVAGGGVAQSLWDDDQPENAAGWKNTIIRYANGGALRVSDVGKIFDDVENGRAAGWFDTKRTVVLVIRRQPGANILDVIDRVKKILPEVPGNIHPAIDVEVAIDRAQTIRASVDDVEFSLILSVGLVVLVVFVFLRSLWATFIPSVAVPLSLVGTFAVMYLCNYSLDNLSLMALTISTGFVVDDAIVVTENVQRFIEQGVPPLTAALRGAKQIGFTIVSITASLLAVFIPILLMGGLIGRLFREFAVTLAIAITVSAVISLTLTPMLCAKLLRPPSHEAPNWLSRTLEAGFMAMQNAYAKALRFVLRHQLATGIATILTIAVTAVLFMLSPRGLFPQQDTGLITGFSDAPQDISFPAFKAAQEKLNAIVRKDPDVDHMIAFMGSGGASTGNTGTMFIGLKPKPGRKASSEEVIARLRPKLSTVPGVNLFLQSVQDVRVGGRLARSQYQFTVQDANLDELRMWAPKLVTKLRQLKELKDVNTDQQTAGLQLDVIVDRDTAARLSLSMSEIDDALYDAFGQRQVATTFTQRNQYRVVLEALPQIGADPDVLGRIWARNDLGVAIPLSAVAKLHPTSTSLSVNHQGQFPSVTISFNASLNVSLSEIDEAIKNAEHEIGLPGTVRASFQGTAQAFKESTSTLWWLIAGALICVYIVLGMLYESFIHPITILSTIPSAGVGALLALLLTGTEVSIIAFVGIILLIGIVKKNAILMIDFAIEAERDEKLSPLEAIEKACVLRFRPIMMTTMAALLGAIPLAIGSGTGSEMRRPLGIAIVGGLIFSQLLTLFTTPVTYLAMGRLGAWLRWLFSSGSEDVRYSDQ